MTTKRRHVSRWQPVGNAAKHESESKQHQDAEAGRPHMSLRYLNEFVGKVQCSSDLLHHELFPDAKEITESMGLFNAVRRYLLHDEQADNDATQQQPPSHKSDGIVVVGDGNTPRSAALFAYRMRQWKSFSIDPAMEKNSTERSIGWQSISNLVVIRNKIENVRITLRRAIIVLMHAHVTLEQALSAVDAESIVGVVTIPCCNWYGEQEKLFGRLPDLVYDDFSILSDHREIRLWVGGNEATQNPTSFKDHEDFAALANETKGCVRKECVSDEPSTHSSGAVETAADGENAAHLPSTKTLAFFYELLQQAPTLEASQEIEPLSSQIQSHLPVESNMLVFGVYKNQPLERKLLGAGYGKLYTLVDSSLNQGVLTAQVNRFQPLSNSSDELTQTPVGRLRISHTPSGIDVLFAPLSTSDSLRLDCVVDHEWLFRGFRQQSKNAQLFQDVCLLLQQVVACFRAPSLAPNAITSFICVTQRKNWRKMEYLAHDSLNFVIQTLAIQSSGPSVGDQAKTKQHRQLYAYVCHEQSASVLTGHASEQHMSTKDHVLLMKRLMDVEFNSRKRSIGTMPIEPITIAFAATLQHQETDGSPSTVDNEDLTTTEGVHLQMTGRITRIRRYTNGVCFLSLGNPGDVLKAKTAANAQQQQTVQVLLQLSVLDWTSEFSDRVLSILHRGDEVRVLGCMGTTDKGKPILYATALTLERGEFEAYD